MNNCVLWICLLTKPWVKQCNEFTCENSLVQINLIYFILIRFNFLVKFPLESPRKIFDLKGEDVKKLRIFSVVEEV